MDGDCKDDLDLAARVVQGDGDALEAFYAYHAAPVVSFVYHELNGARPDLQSVIAKSSGRVESLALLTLGVMLAPVSISSHLFAALKPCLVGDRAAQPYAELAARLGMEEGAVKVAAHRLRQRYRELLRAEIANTVASPGEVDAEMRHLFNVLAR